MTMYEGIFLMLQASLVTIAMITLVVYLLSENKKK